jgi:hypothetical protein
MQTSRDGIIENFDRGNAEGAALGRQTDQSQARTPLFGRSASVRRLAGTRKNFIIIPPWEQSEFRIGKDQIFGHPAAVLAIGSQTYWLRPHRYLRAAAR